MKAIANPLNGMRLSQRWSPQEAFGSTHPLCMDLSCLQTMRIILAFIISLVLIGLTRLRIVTAKILWACLTLLGVWIAVSHFNGIDRRFSAPLSQPFLAQNPQISSIAQPSVRKAQTKPVAQPVDPMIAAVGDIACVPNYAKSGGNAPTGCRMKETSDLLLNKPLAAVLPLGDLQYERGEFEGFQQSYDPSWGRVKGISHPVAGNHEYYTKGASGYYKYFGQTAGAPNKGYYSYDLGSWHLIALNSNCQDVGGCQAGSPQEQWLKQDLARHPKVCTLAYWHHPRFSSGVHGNDQNLDAFWQALYQSGAELILTGHDHHYERFAPQTPQAESDLKNGVREFVVGTGGKSLRPVLQAQPHSEVRNDSTYGVLNLTLRPRGYTWQFEPIAGQTFTDSGQDICH